jgi:hypothetical protein
MDQELQNKLYEKYPKLFKQKDLPMDQTCMNWGICTENGWYWLIDNLCSCIQDYIDVNKKKQVEIVQLKEKFGSMRFYTNHSDDLISGMIWLAEHYSWNICEKCGSTNDITHTKGWIKTLCKKCAEKKNEA